MEEKEKEVIQKADIMFAGGDTLLKNKGKHHKNATCFPCGVDTEHFGKVRKEKLPIPGDIKNIQGIILGYYGAVDERVDYKLIQYLAEYKKEWNIVLLGPIVKVKRPEIFDTLPNIHYLGGKEYHELPDYCACFDICLIPFKINDPVTKHLNPTKTLEYLATGKPVVSTSIPDIVAHFSGVVSIAENYQTFAQLIEKNLAGYDEAQKEKGLKLVQNKSWEAMVHGMETIIQQHLEKEGNGYSTIYRKQQS